MRLDKIFDSRHFKGNGIAQVGDISISQSNHSHSSWQENRKIENGSKNILENDKLFQKVKSASSACQAVVKWVPFYRLGPLAMSRFDKAIYINPLCTKKAIAQR